LKESYLANKVTKKIAFFCFIFCFYVFFSPPFFLMSLTVNYYILLIYLFVFGGPRGPGVSVVAVVSLWSGPLVWNNPITARFRQHFFYFFWRTQIKPNNNSTNKSEIKKNQFSMFFCRILGRAN